MRQAGRFLPEYRKIKETHSLKEMFQTPEIAAKITCLPVDILKVDAAILFADILTLPAAMGFNIDFPNTSGPIIKNPVKTSRDMAKVHDFEGLAYVAETIKQVNRALPKNIPLIGFAGSPFTVLCYLVEGGSSVDFTNVFDLIHDDEKLFHRLMKVLAKNTIGYLKLQKKAGIKVFQVFDTWGGILKADEYTRLVLPYIQEVFAEVDLPSIYYLKNCAHLIRQMDESGADFLSVCNTVTLGKDPVLAKTKKGVQGNLFNGLLSADYPTLEKALMSVLKGAQSYKKYIFNLSHGIFPETEVDKAKFIVDAVHKFKWGGTRK